MSRIACIGSRETPSDILRWMEEAGASLVRAGHTIVSGNAAGSDQAWARGGNSVDPTKVELCLPWKHFEAQAIHPRNVVRVLDEVPEDDRALYYKVTQTYKTGVHQNQSVRKLFARNAMIVLGPLRPGSNVHWNRVSRVLAYGIGSGGTGRCCAIARRFGADVLDIARPEIREEFDWTTVTGPVFP